MNSDLWTLFIDEIHLLLGLAETDEAPMPYLERLSGESRFAVGQDALHVGDFLPGLSVVGGTEAKLDPALDEQCLPLIEAHARQGSGLGYRNVFGVVAINGELDAQLRLFHRQRAPRVLAHRILIADALGTCELYLVRELS